MSVHYLVGKSGGLELRDNIYGHYRSIFNHHDVIGQPAKQSNSVKKRKKLLRRSRSFKDIEVGINPPNATSY